MMRPPFTGLKMDSGADCKGKMKVRNSASGCKCLTSYAMRAMVTGRLGSHLKQRFPVEKNVRQKEAKIRMLRWAEYLDGEVN